MKYAVVLALIAAGCSHSEHRYTCAEILGPHPEPGQWKVIPRGYSVTSELAFTLDGTPVRGRPDFSVWDEQRHLVCDSKGQDVPQ